MPDLLDELRRCVSQCLSDHRLNRTIMMGQPESCSCGEPLLGNDFAGQRHVVAKITEAIGTWARAHPDEALPWDDFAEGSTQTKPLYVRQSRHP